MPDVSQLADVYVKHDFMNMDMTVIFLKHAYYFTSEEISRGLPM